MGIDLTQDPDSENRTQELVGQTKGMIHCTSAKRYCGHTQEISQKRVFHPVKIADGRQNLPGCILNLDRAWGKRVISVFNHLKYLITMPV